METVVIVTMLLSLAIGVILGGAFFMHRYEKQLNHLGLLHTIVGIEQQGIEAQKLIMSVTGNAIADIRRPRLVDRN
jgi:Na+-transporting methylmalonyl-CoA/oxaloacetate decarboxylase beta subunit